MKWTAPANNRASITGYTVAYASSDTTCPSTLSSDWTTNTTTSTSYTISNLTGSNTTYTICVRASNKAGDSLWASDKAKPAIKPNNPANLSASAGEDAITLEWSAYTDTTNGGTAITGYTVECQLVSGTVTLAPGAAPTGPIPGSPLAEPPPATPSPALSEDATYNVRIKATNGITDDDDNTILTAITAPRPASSPTDEPARAGESHRHRRQPEDHSEVVRSCQQQGEHHQLHRGICFIGYHLAPRPLAPIGPPTPPPAPATPSRT